MARIGIGNHLRVGKMSAKPDMVFLHGFGDNPSSLKGFAASIALDKYSAILPRMRSSRNEPDMIGWSPAHLAGDLQVICHPLACHYLIGYSYGGIIASTYALMVGASRLKGLIVVDQAFAPQYDRSEPEPWSVTSDLLWHYDYTHHLTMTAKLGIPTLLIVGSQSHVVPKAEVAWWENIQESQLSLKVLSDDHRGLVKPWSSAAEAIRNFIQGIESPTKEMER